MHQRTGPARPERPPRGHARHHRFPRRAWAASVLTLAVAVTAGGPAAATTATGPEGQSITVSATENLDPAGQTVTVNGSGFDLSTGIYVALCVDNGPGQAPSPCLGGADMEGGGGASAWISSNPPSYGEGLAQPFDEVDGKGSFSVRFRVTANDEFTDCLDASAAPNGCVIGTRADHTRTTDRSADVLIPVTFATPGSDDGSGDSGSESSGDPEPVAEAGDATATAASDTTTDGRAGGLAATGIPGAGALSVAFALTAVGATLILARRRTGGVRS